MADDQILAFGEALKDDGQESFSNDDSLPESVSYIDPRVPDQEEYPLPEDSDGQSFVDRQKSYPLLSKVRSWVEKQHKPTSQENKLLAPDEKFYVDSFE